MDSLYDNDFLSAPFFDEDSLFGIGECWQAEIAPDYSTAALDKFMADYRWVVATIEPEEAGVANNGRAASPPPPPPPPPPPQRFEDTIVLAKCYTLVSAVVDAIVAQRARDGLATTADEAQRWQEWLLHFLTADNATTRRNAGMARARVSATGRALLLMQRGFPGVGAPGPSGVSPPVPSGRHYGQRGGGRRLRLRRRR